MLSKTIIQIFWKWTIYEHGRGGKKNKKKKERRNSKLLRKFLPPSLSLSASFGSFSEQKELASTKEQRSIVVRWWYNAAEPTEFHCVTLTQMVFVLLNSAWACWVISSPSTPGHSPVLKQIESLKLDVTEMVKHRRHGRRWIYTQVKEHAFLYLETTVKDLWYLIPNIITGSPLSSYSNSLTLEGCQITDTSWRLCCLHQPRAIWLAWFSKKKLETREQLACFSKLIQWSYLHIFIIK